MGAAPHKARADPATGNSLVSPFGAAPGLLPVVVVDDFGVG